MWVGKDFLRIKTMKHHKKKADEYNYTEIKITCTLNIRGIHYITPSYSPSNKIIITDVAKHTECVVCAQNCFNALHVFIHVILITSHFGEEETDIKRLQSCTGQELRYEPGVSGSRAHTLSHTEVLSAPN